MIAPRNPNARLWMVDMQELMGHDKFAKLLLTLWAVWWARWKVSHEQEFQSPLSTLAFISKFLEDQALIPSVASRTPSYTSTSTSKWSAPTEGFVKINVDASVSKNKRNGCHLCGMS